MPGLHCKSAILPPNLHFRSAILCIFAFKRRFTAGLKAAGQRLICLGKDEDEDENCLEFRV